MNGSMYRGDLSDDETLFHRIYPGSNVSLQTEGFSQLKLQLNVGFGKFAEQYDGLRPPAPHGVQPVDFVETSFFYGDLRIKYRLMKRKMIQPYVSAGAGFMIFSPKDEQGKFLSDAILTRPEGESYNTAIPQLPLSLGVQVRLTEMAWLGLEYTYRITPTDYLDNTGQLGRMPGNDKIHSLQVSVYVNLSRPPQMPPKVKKEKKPKEEKPLAADLSKLTEPLTTLDPMAPHIPVPQKTYAPAQLKEVEVAGFSPLTLPEEDSSEVATEPVIEPTDEGMSDWDKLAWEAWNKGKVFYYRPQADDTFEDLFARFRISEAIVKRVNNIKGDQPPTGGEIVLPDLREYIGQMENEAIIEEDQSEMVQREANAIKQGKYVYYHVTQEDDLVSVAARYKIRVVTIKRLNFLKDNHVYPNSYLRLPDIGISSND